MISTPKVLHQILIQDLILVYWVAFNFFNGYPLTPPQLCFIRVFLVKLKDSNVYMFFLSNIYTPFVLINIYIYIHKNDSFFFFLVCRKNTGFALFGCHFENEKEKFFSVEYNCDGLLNMWRLNKNFRYIELIFSWSPKFFLQLLLSLYQTPKHT